MVSTHRFERHLGSFTGWRASGISLDDCRRTEHLIEDLKKLGTSVDPCPSAPAPDLPTLAHALGALYVVEGAALGGRLILRDIEERLGGQIDQATTFFGGGGEAIGPRWHRFQTALDAFGGNRPDLSDNVAVGASRTFEGLLAWFAPFLSPHDKG